MTLKTVAQVYQAIAPAEVTLINPLLGDGSRATRETLRAVYGEVENAYRVMQEPERWNVQPDATGEERDKAILSAFSGPN